MKTTFAAAAGMTALFVMPAMAADLPVKAPPMAPAPGINWTGLYIFGGGGGGLWNADSNMYTTDLSIVSADQRMGGSGWFGTVGAGYDRQFSRNWVAGIFADGQFGNISGSIKDPRGEGVIEGQEKLRTSWAAGIRLGYLVAPNVLSYVNGGYSGSEWSGAQYGFLVNGARPLPLVTSSFHRDGWFVGSGVENSLDILGVAAPGWFMKTEYRAAHYDRIALAETSTGGPGFGAPGSLTGTIITFKPWVQTVSTSLVYRFDSTAPVTTPTYTKARAAMPSWTGFSVFGGAGGGLWAADSDTATPGFWTTHDQRLGGSGWFGTVGVGYDWQFRSSWVAGLFADGQFGNINGTISDPSFFADIAGSEKLRASWAAGARLGYLVAPNVLSYVNGGYTGSEWSGSSFAGAADPLATPRYTTPSFRRDGWFVGGGVENSLDLLGVTAAGWSMKTEYRAAYYGRVTLTEISTGTFPFIYGPAGAPTGTTVTFKPWTQTISTSLVYRFNAPVTATY